MLTDPVVLHGGPLDGAVWRVFGSSRLLCIPKGKDGQPDPRAKLDPQRGWFEYYKQADGRYQYQGVGPAPKK